jgi:murein DD-endopeptidase MepM/ murein hydrolase activator NlpD
LNIFRKILIILSLFLCFSAQGNYASAKYDVVGPAFGKISSGFGIRPDPFTGKPAFHSGIDIAANMGTPIYAIQDGVVIHSGSKGGYGTCVMIDHYYPDVPQIPRLQTLYGHNSTNLVNVGDTVKRGQVIAYVGSTGRSNGPHLHFEVRYNKMYVNPIDYLYKLPSYLDYVAVVRAKNRYTSFNGNGSRTR